MLNVAGKCAVLWKAMQSFVDQQHDGVGNVKYRKELSYRYIKFVYYNHNRVYVNAICRDVVIANLVGLLRRSSYVSRRGAEN